MMKLRKRWTYICILCLAMPLLIGAMPWSFVDLKDPNPMIDIDSMIQEKVFPWSDPENVAPSQTEQAEDKPEVPKPEKENATIKIRVTAKKIYVDGTQCKGKEEIEAAILTRYGRNTTIEITDYYAEYYTYQSLQTCLEELGIQANIIEKTAMTMEEIG